MLTFDQVTRCFGRRTALDGVSFQAARGEVIGVIGPNGAGKTTLLRLGACFLQPTRGAIDLNGMDTFRQSLAVRRSVGYLPERCPLYDDMTVREYLRFRARLKGLPLRKVRVRVRDLAEQVGLGEDGGRPIAGLSLGSRRRLGVADALLSDPKLLLLDDPLANVDAVETARLVGCIAASSRHAIVLVSGHTLALFAGLCARYLVLRGGRLVLDATRQDLQTRHGGATLAMEVAGAGDAALRRAVARYPGGAGATVDLQPDGWWRVCWPMVSGGEALRDTVASDAARMGWRLRAVNVIRPPLENVLADCVAGRNLEPASAHSSGGPS
jgi:ABC-2 type transport system ATP-binding protein